ncbi:YebG family protein [Edwardsiella tarda]|uniref:YebG family protein n=1 Tax=Edwardsiella tarda TaxID=636 RepID=UPI00098EEE8B|nr:YebG family protein [Edwardsiella tarda]WKS79811.1 YebG family protein [Edwardsiella tarda]
MAVTIQYVVVRDGVEKMTFASKKEADNYDKMLDLADNLSEWLASSPVMLAEETREALGFYLAEQKESLSRLLRGASLASLQNSDADEGRVREVEEGAERQVA